MEAGFSTELPVYMAAGVLSYDDTTHMDEARSKLSPYSKAVIFKEKYLDKAELAGLHPEQQALVDFLVLAECRHFVGISLSTFSVYLREYRALQGLAARSTSWLVKGTAVGTDPLFDKAAVFP
jgi:hypothetical protein